MEHRGHRILYVDYRNLGTAECVETLRQHVAAVDAASEPVLCLVDARGAVFGSEFMHAAKAAGPKNTTRTLKRAIIGVDGPKEMLLQFFNLAAAPVPMIRFNSMGEALAYLTEPARPAG